MVLENALFLIVGLIFLVKGSDLFVKSAATIAKKLGVSELVIGLTLVAVGTSLPELMSAIFASVKHESGLVIGNIVGANIANMGLVVGLVALIAVIKTKDEMVWRDGYIALFISVLLYLFISNGVISKIEGMIFLFLYFAYVMFLFETNTESGKKYGFREFTEYFFKFKYIMTIRSRIIASFVRKEGPAKERKIWDLFKAGIFKDLIMMIISGFLLLNGANYVVGEAVFFARLFDVPSTVIGIFIAIGTTMPEMSVALAASRKGLGNIIIGDAIGSCITNTLLILGVASIINPVSVKGITLFYTAPFMILITILLLVFIRSDWKIKRGEGIILLFLYLLFFVLLFALPILPR